MDKLGLILAAAFCLSVFVVTAARGGLRTRRRIAQALVISLAGSVAIIWLVPEKPQPDPVDVTANQVDNRPIEVAIDGYVGSDACRDCHPHNHATWHASYHRTMTQVVSPQSVIAPFENVEVSDRGETYRLARLKDEFWVDMPNPYAGTFSNAPPRAQYPIVLSTGSHHMQAYWYAISSRSRMMSLLPFIYLKEQQRWVPRDAVFLKPTEDKPSIEMGRWNTTCIRCHATHGQMRTRTTSTNLPDGTQVMEVQACDTRVAEFGISCEACHGPGAQHVKSRQQSSNGDFTAQAPETIVQPERLSAQRASQICGQCHSVSQVDPSQLADARDNGFPFRPGDDLHQTRIIVRKKTQLNIADDDPHYFEDQFWPDGMVRISGREYNGLINSPCHERGELSCLSCHQLHQSKDDSRPIEDWANDQLRFTAHANDACTQCHDRFVDEQTLVDHTHHAADSSGSNCYNCHMSYTTYGLLKAIRSHQIDSPSVQASLDTGRPNACNQCHLDQTLGWSAGHLNNWYATPQPELTEDEQEIAASIIWLLRGDAGQRALMAWSMGWEPAREAAGDKWLAPYLAQLLDDPYDAVRYIAHRSLKQLAGYEQIEYDFVGPPANRSIAQQQTRTLWQDISRKENITADPRLLIDEASNLMTDTFERLLKQRNDRPQFLRE